jgi:hypothetical protein
MSTQKLLDLVRRAGTTRGHAAICRSRMAATPDTTRIAMFARFASELDARAESLDGEAERMRDAL